MIDIRPRSPLTDDDEYVALLLSRRDKLFYVHNWGGNRGDLLIQMGTAELVRRIGLRTTDDPAQAQCILWPGGNPSMWYAAGVVGFRTFGSRYPQAEFIIGPATFQFERYNWVAPLLAARSPIAGIFARDPVSFANLRRVRLGSRTVVGLSHDPALMLLESSWLAEQKALARQEHVLAGFRGGDIEGSDTRVGRFRPWAELVPKLLLRRFQRKAGLRWRQRKCDHVRRLAGDRPVLTEDIARWPAFEDYVRAVRDAAEVHTDRLHVMLLGAMLGKDVFAYETAYGKLEAVYHHSLRPWARVRLVRVE